MYIRLKQYTMDFLRLSIIFFQKKKRKKKSRFVKKLGLHFHKGWFYGMMAEKFTNSHTGFFNFWKNRALSHSETWEQIHP